MQCTHASSLQGKAGQGGGYAGPPEHKICLLGRGGVGEGAVSPGAAADLVGAGSCEAVQAMRCWAGYAQVGAVRAFWQWAEECQACLMQFGLQLGHASSAQLSQSSDAVRTLAFEKNPEERPLENQPCCKGGAVQRFNAKLEMQLQEKARSVPMPCKRQRCTRCCKQESPRSLPRRQRSRVLEAGHV